MRRADRLFRIVQKLRRRRSTTAQQLAEALEVSERTIYRDVQDLVASGVPIQGEAGVGYRLDKSFDLPPLMFDEEELEALVLGARVVGAWGDPSLARAAESLLSKVQSVLPKRLEDRLASTTLFAPDFHLPKDRLAGLDTLRGAIKRNRKVTFAYEDRQKTGSSRIVHPLGLFYWGVSWSLGAWCELRQGFRNFRLDRISELRVLDEEFEPVPERSLEALFKAYEEGSSRR